MRLFILALGFIIGLYFLSLELSTLEFSKCSMRLLSPCSLAYVNIQIYFYFNEYLLTLELAPPLVMKLDIEVPQIRGRNKVDKPIPHIAVVLQISQKQYLKITRQIQEVIRIFEVEIDLL